ncbi:MAG: SDR family oxidoreductase [Kiritimatiellae bacterium]|nr:SDR family oxidoreductase [Kiritimatiellia bacterium]
MDYLVTGGAGFIGSNIVRQLVGEGKEVRILDNLATGRRVNIEDLLGDVDFIEGDLRDEATAKRAVAGVRNVLHLGALPSVIRSVNDPIGANETNIDGTLNMLVAARDAGVKRFVFSSSSSVYGNTPTLPKREDMTPMPLSPYAVQKLTGEHYCRVFHRLYGLQTVCLRYFNVFGPRQDPSSQYSAVIPLFVGALRNDEPPTIHGDGGQTRDFTFVGDVVKANICACTAPDDAAGGVFNVAYEDRTSINDLFNILARLLGKDIKPHHVDPRPGDVRDSQGDPTAARTVLRWEAETTVEEGLKRTVDFYLES